MEEKLKGNDTTLAVHHIEIAYIKKSVDQINTKLDNILPVIAVIDSDINNLKAWRNWATGLGGSALLGLVMLIIAHMIGG